MADSFIIANSPLEAATAKTAGAVFLAGGTEINRLGAVVKADSYISIRKMPQLRQVTDDQGIIRMGAACTFQELIDSELVPDYFKEALRFMASRTRRNMATIGGNIALRRDDSFIIPTLIAANASLTLFYIDDGVAKVCDISVSDYVARDFSGCDDDARALYESINFDNSLIIDIAIPSDARIISIRNANTAQSHARLTFAMARTDCGYSIGMGMKNVGIHRMDKLAGLLSSSSQLAEDEILDFVRGCDCLTLEDDRLYGSADYRRYLLGITAALAYSNLM